MERTTAGDAPHKASWCPPFITLEGIDGSGKSTQAALLAEWLEAETGRPVLRTFEPGGWEAGQALRELILHGHIPDAATELLLFLADRKGHLAEVVLPALAAGQIVLCERYTDSTRAYQAGGRGVTPAFLEPLLAACDFPVPDLTIFLDLPPRTAAKRLADRGGGDRFEASGLEFMERVARAYAEIARREPRRVLEVPAAGAPEDVAREVRRGVLRHLGVLL